MDDTSGAVIQIIFIIVFLIGQFLVARAKMKKRQQQKQLLPQNENTLPLKDERSAYEEAGERATKTIIGRTPSSEVSVDSQKRRKSLLAKTYELLEKTEAVAWTCYQKDFVIAGNWIQSSCREKLEHILDRSGLRDTRGEVSKKRMDELEKELDILGEHIELAAGIVDKRVSSKSDVYNSVDRITKESVDVFMLHAKRLGLHVANMLPLGVDDSHPAASAGLNCVRLPDSLFENVSSFALIPSETAEVVYSSTPKLAKSIDADIGLPDAKSSLYHFLKTGRLTPQGLISAWMRWIFKDVAGVLSMGEFHGVALLEEFADTTEGPEKNRFGVDEMGNVSSIPLSMRFSVILEALDHIEMPGFILTEEKIKDVCGDEREIVMDAAGLSDISVPLDVFKDDLRSVVTALIETPLTGFGGFRLKELPHFMLNDKEFEAAKEMADVLAEGKVPWFNRAMTVPVAIGIANARYSVSSGRAARAALMALVKENRERVKKRQHPASIRNLKGAFTNRGFIARAVMLSSMSKQRGGISRLF